LQHNVYIYAISEGGPKLLSDSQALKHFSEKIFYIDKNSLVSLTSLIGTSIQENCIQGFIFNQIMCFLVVGKKEIACARLTQCLINVSLHQKNAEYQKRWSACGVIFARRKLVEFYV